MSLLSLESTRHPRPKDWRRVAGIASDLSRISGRLIALSRREKATRFVSRASRGAGGRGPIIACGGDGTITRWRTESSRRRRNPSSASFPAARRRLSAHVGIPARARDAALALREGKRAASTCTGYVRDQMAKASCDTSERHVVWNGGAVIKRVKTSHGDREGPRAFSMVELPSRLRRCKRRSTLEIPPWRSAWTSSRDSHTVRNFLRANARFFGGGMKIAPGAKLDDAS